MLIGVLIVKKMNKTINLINDNYEVNIIKVDCMKNSVFCKKNKITSYPTTMLYSECELQNIYKGYITYKEFEEDNE